MSSQNAEMFSISIFYRDILLMFVYSIVKLGSHHRIRNFNFLWQAKNNNVVKTNYNRTSAWQMENTDQFETLTLNSAKIFSTSFNLDFADISESGSKLSAFLSQDKPLVNNLAKEQSNKEAGRWTASSINLSTS